MTEMKKPLEAVLFAGGEPVSEKQLCSILEVDEEALHELLEALERDLETRGIMLQETAGGWQLVTRPECFAYVEKLAEVSDRKLSKAAMETLSIIAFKQPITKQEIEKIRGVKAERVLAQLIARELVTEVGRKNVIGRPFLYGTTDTFLQSFGLKSLDELPALPEPDIDNEQAEQLLLMNLGDKESISSDEGNE